MSTERSPYLLAAPSDRQVCTVIAGRYDDGFSEARRRARVGDPEPEAWRIV